MPTAPIVSHRVSGAWTRSVMVSMERLGMDSEAICKQAGVDHAELDDPNARVPIDDLVRYWNAAATLNDDAALGLHAGEHLGARYNHVVAMLIFTGRTLGESIELGLQYQDIIADGGSASLVQDGSDRIVQFARIEDELPPSPHQVEMFVVTAYELLRVVSVNAFRPKEIRFAHPYRGLMEDYERVFECPVLFDQPHAAMVIDDANWRLQLEIWDPVLSDRLESLAIEMKARIESPGMIGSASQAIRGLLPRGACDLVAVAKQLGMSDRTLQRQLHQEGTSFRQLVDVTRRAIVMGGLEQGAALEELARRAGFASVRVLRRSIDRWREDDHSAQR